MARDPTREDAGRIGQKSSALAPADFGIGELFGSIRDALVVADARSGRIVLWNPAAEAMFGYSAAEAAGMMIEALVPEGLL